MIRQDDGELNDRSYFPFFEYGCALFDIANYGVMHGSYVFSRATFLEDVKQGIKDGILDDDLTIMHWDKVCKAFKLPYKLVFENGTHKLATNRKLNNDELQLLYLYNPRTKYHHFVCGDDDNHITYDSLGESVTAKAYRDGIGYVESKRVLRRIK